MPPDTRLDDRDPDRLNTYERDLLRHVRRFGWQSTHVGADPDTGMPAFTYSIGFWASQGQPEVLVFDFPAGLAHDVMGTIHRRRAAGDTLPTGRPIPGILSGEEVCLLPVDPDQAEAHLRSCHWFYREAAFPALQLVWPDPAGRFPWEDGFDTRLAARQRDLTATGWPGG